jgi:hypothetical protein
VSAVELSIEQEDSEETSEEQVITKDLRNPQTGNVRRTHSVSECTSLDTAELASRSKEMGN